MKRYPASKSFRIVILGVVIIAVVLVPLSFKHLPTSSYPELNGADTAKMSLSELQGFFTSLAEVKGAPYAFKVLKVAPVPANTDLHLLGHSIGDILFKQQGALGIKVCTQDFRNACSHSIVIGLLTSRGEQSLTEIASACRQAPGGKGAYTMCFHGLGHGVLSYSGYDLARAIPLCQKVGTQQYHNQEYIECVGGVVMELITGVHDPLLRQKMDQRYLSSINPLAPCSETIIPVEVKAICYTYLTPHLFQVAGMDLSKPNPQAFAKAFKLCNQTPSDQVDFRSVCTAAFGKEFVVLAPDRDIRQVDQMSNNQLQKIVQWCNLAGDPVGIRGCLLNALGSLYWGGENKPEASIRFCSLMDESNRTACFSDLFTMVNFYKTPSKSFCNEIPDPYKNNCRLIIS